MIFSLLIFVIVGEIMVYMFFQLHKQVFFFLVGKTVIINLTIFSTKSHNYIIKITFKAEFILLQPPDGLKFIFVERQDRQRTGGNVLINYVGKFIFDFLLAQKKNRVITDYVKQEYCQK